jgi:hypothetical protein
MRDPVYWPLISADSLTEMDGHICGEQEPLITEIGRLGMSTTVPSG